MKSPFLSLILSLLCTVSVFAQCPTSITNLSTEVTNASCPSTGRVVIHSSAESNTSVIYQIIAGPAEGGWSSTPQSSNVFSTLKAGTYTFKASCGSVEATVSATVSSTYTPPTVNATVSNICTNYQTGATITVSGTGSSTPLRYAVLKSDNANADDATFTYQTSNVFNVTEFGTYQVRVKDACNNFVTQTVQLAPQAPRAGLTTWGYTYNDCNTLRVSYNLYNTNNQNVIDLSKFNYRIEIWESTSSTCPGTAPTTAPTQVYTTSTNNYFSIQSTTNSYYYRITSMCGEVFTGCNVVPNHTLQATAQIAVGCAAGDANAIIFQTNAPGNYTLNITGFDAANNITSNHAFPSQASAIFRNITPAHHYSYTLTDVCGRTYQGTVTTPVPGSATASIRSYASWCTTVLGTGVVEVYFSGHIPGLASMQLSNITLHSTTTANTYNAIAVNYNPLYATFYNVPPGQYEIVFRTTTGTCETKIPLTVVADNDAPLAFSLTAGVTQLCGGKGSITSSVTTNSSASVTYTLTGGAATQSNTTGSFTNLDPGTYTVTAALNGACTQGQTNLTASRTFTITAAGQPPVINKKIGIACEGSPTGFAGFFISGAGPFTIERKEASQSTYTVVTTSAGNEATVQNLELGKTYDFRVIDNCGIATTTQVTIQPLGVIRKETTLQPCNGQPYILAVENLPGATYSWTYNGGAPFSTSNEVAFSSYSINNNGHYEVTISFGSCVTRKVTFDLNSTYCGSGLPVTFDDIEAVVKNGKLFVNWSTLREIDNASFEIEVSPDGQSFRKIGTVLSESQSGPEETRREYSFEITAGQATTAMAATGIMLLLAGFAARRKKLMLVGAIFFAGIFFAASCNKNNNEMENKDTGINYVRIAVVDKDGGKTYSKVIKVVYE